jgi:hypothetical protein
MVSESLKNTGPRPAQPTTLALEIAQCREFFVRRRRMSCPGGLRSDLEACY